MTINHAFADDMSAYPRSEFLLIDQSGRTLSAHAGGSIYVPFKLPSQGLAVNLHAWHPYSTNHGCHWVLEPDGRATGAGAGGGDPSVLKAYYGAYKGAQCSLCKPRFAD
jgi:hypothetical protein